MARDIVATTKDKAHPHGQLQRLIVSNVRLNHVSGFVFAEKLFRRMEIEEIWLPASEDPGDERARVRVERRQQRLRELRRVARGLPREAKDLGRSLSGVLNLFGDCEQGGTTPAPGESAAALLFLRAREQTGTRLRYLDTRAAPQPLFNDLSAVRAYVLGPQAATTPAAGQRASATQQGALDLAGSFLAAQQRVGLTAEEAVDYKELLERNLPFAPTEQTTYTTGTSTGATAAPVFAPATHADFFAAHYFAANENWRRIDFDWMGVARSLTLALDHEANNASLALIFEIAAGSDPRHRRTLLFPGDAQTGAWKLWDELSWEVSDDSASPSLPRRVTARELLRRTAVYKVAHHCSETGTPLEGGLELMERGDLIALLPVNRATAEDAGWDLPYAPLLRRLDEKTHGRILSTDPEQPRLDARTRPDTLSAWDWQAFRAAVRETDLYIEYTIDA